MSLISMLCPRCLGDSFERDHAYKCRPPELDMTPTFPPSPAQGETAGVREQRLRELISSVPNGGSQYEVDLHAALCELVAVRQQLAELQREKAAAVGLQQGTALVVRSVGETRPVPERGKPFSAQEALRQPPPNRYSEFPDCAQPSRGKCETCAGTKVNPKWSAGDRFAAMDCPDCAQGGSPADPERQGVKCDHTGCVVNTHTGSLTGECTRCGETFAFPTLAQFTSPPPTDDIVAGLREKTLAKLKEFVVMSNDQLLKCDLNRLHFTILDAIAALERAK